MSFKPPLSFEELKEIQGRGRENPDVMRLLWEIRRLHSIVLRLDQLIRSEPVRAGAIGLILNAAETEIANDPVVLDRKRLDQLEKR